MTLDPENDEIADYGLVMPFVVCKSKGGTYDDDAYVAGWEAAKFDSTLAAISTMGLRLPVTFNLPFHTDNQAQLDLIAMRYGFTATFDPIDETWVGVSINA